MLLYIVRHGDPNYELDCLTERGKQQAEAVGKRLFDSGINRIFSSPMGRAVETAQPACRLLGLDCHIESWTQEIDTQERSTDYPDGILRTVTEVQNSLYRENGAQELPYQRAGQCPGIAQSRICQAADRIEKAGNAFLERLGYREENGVYRILQPNEDRVALFCHHDFAMAWLSRLLHLPLHTFWAGFRYTHTGVTVLELRNYENGVTAPLCLCLSDMSHLYAAGLDMIHDHKIRL